MFEKYGPIRSCKVATDPLTSLSRCYGYVWFLNEKSCLDALKDKNKLGYAVQLYQAFCLRQIEKMNMGCSTNSNLMNSDFTPSCSVIISGYPSSLTELQLA